MTEASLPSAWHRNVRNAIRSFSPIERVLFVLALLGILAGVIGAFASLHMGNSTTLPARGGTLTEGIVGTPRFINPILTVSDADSDMTTLIFSGLMRIDNRGELVPDLAKSYTISDEGKTYTFTLRDKLTFHDGRPLSASDVLFTIESIRDPLLRSPKRIAWEGISVEAPNRTTIVFQLPEPYAGFLSNATLGVIPKHLWNGLAKDQFMFSDMNVRPIGSGPFFVDDITTTKRGIPISYTLKAFRGYHDVPAFLNRFIVKFYATDNDLALAFNNGNIDLAGGLQEEARDALRHAVQSISFPLPRIFGVFLNYNQKPLFLESSVGKALDRAINRERIITGILGGNGVPLTSPFVPGMVGWNEETLESRFNPEEAEAILKKNGWDRNEETGRWQKTKDKKTTELAFSLATSDTPHLKRVAEFIQEDLESIGIAIELQVYDSQSLQEEVIRPRRYDALLFGQTYNHDSDLFAFWHSSQRNDPGLNIALYANVKVDHALESILRSTDEDQKIEDYETIRSELEKDMPALFLFAPRYLYATRKWVGNFGEEHLLYGIRERLSSAPTWYQRTHRVWKTFIRQN
jgi:peptide/nickel transport system substrate-binding protein